MLCLVAGGPALAAVAKKVPAMSPPSALTDSIGHESASSIPEEQHKTRKWQDPNWITAGSTLIYTLITGWLIFQQRRSRLDDKLPCVVVRARLNPSRSGQWGQTPDEWKLRLINIGVGPAFIEQFETKGLSALKDGDHTQDIDRVIGADSGDPDQQVDFANGTPLDLRKSGTHITIRYKDIAGRRFETQFHAGRAEFVRL